MLTASDCASLVDLSGLGALERVNGDVAIAANPTLTDVTGLYAVSNVDGDVAIENNVTLTDAAAQALVDHITTIHGSVTVSGN